MSCRFLFPSGGAPETPSKVADLCLSLCSAWIESCWCIFSRSDAAFRSCTYISLEFGISPGVSCLLRLPPPLWKNKYMFHARPLMHQIISLITAEANNDAIQETIKRNQRVGIYDSAFKNFNKTRSQIYRSKQPLNTLIKLVAAALFLKGFIVCVGVQSLIFVWFAA